MPPNVNPLAIPVVSAIMVSIVAAWAWVIIRLAMRLPVLPPNTPRIVPWGGWSVLLALFVSFALQLITVIFFNLATTGKPLVMLKEGGMASPKAMMTVTLLANLATVVIVPMLLWMTSGATLEDFGLRFVGLGRQIVRGMVTYPLLAPVVFGTMIVAVMIYGKTNHPLEDAIASLMTPGMAVVMALASVVGAPVGEEFIFRGILLGWLTRVALGVKKKPRQPDSPGEVLRIDLDEDGFTVEQGPDQCYVPADFGDPSANPFEAPQTAILVAPESTEIEVLPAGRAGSLLAANVATSLVFAAMHAAVWPTPIPIFFLSIGLGVLYQRTGSILAPIALHMTFNGVSTLMMFLSLGNPAPAPEVPVIKPVPPAKVEPVMKDAVGLRPFGDRPGILQKKS